MSDTASEVLGLEGPPRPMLLMQEVEQGLPLAALDRVVSAVAPDDNVFFYRMVPRATLARRRKALASNDEAASRLTSEESARVARLAEIWVLALQAWGSEEAARAFLFRPHMLLEMRRPIDVVLANEFGRPLVASILGGLIHGTAV